MKSRTSLGETAERLRRSLNLTGVVATELAELPVHVVPVSIVDDATRPGTGANRNRRFWRFYSQAAAAQTPAIGFRFQQAAVIDSLWMAATGASPNLNIQLYAPGVADPFATATTAPFTDRPVSGTDLQPVLSGQINNVASGAQPQIASLTWPQSALAVIPANWMFDAGWGVYVFTGAAFTGTLTVGIAGRTF